MSNEPERVAAVRADQQGHAAHHLHLEADAGNWRLTCDHDEPWPSIDEDGVTVVSDECWLMSHWENIGADLMGDNHAWTRVRSLPIPVSYIGNGWDGDLELIPVFDQTRAAAPSGADQQEPATCSYCGAVYVGDDHFHTVDPYEGCNGHEVGWQVHGDEADMVAEAYSQEFAGRIVAALNAGRVIEPGDDDLTPAANSPAAAAPSTPGAPEAPRREWRCRGLGGKPCSQFDTPASGRRTGHEGCGYAPAAPPPAVQGAPGDLAALIGNLRADASVVENDFQAPRIASRMRVAANRLTGQRRES